jgi:hypothetical protein
MSEKSVQIVEYITKHGPQTQRDLSDALNIRLSNMAKYLQKPVDDGVLIFDPIRTAGSPRPVRIYSLAEAAIEKEEPASTGFSHINAADPFGLVAKGKQINAGVARACDFIADKVATLREQNQSEAQTTILESAEEKPSVFVITEAMVQEAVFGKTEPAVDVSQNTPIEVAKDISRQFTRPAPIARQRRTVSDDDDDQSPDFLVALLSNSNLEIRIDGRTITLTKARWSHMREFINKVELA